MFLSSVEVLALATLTLLVVLLAGFTSPMPGVPAADPETTVPPTAEPPIFSSEDVVEANNRFALDLYAQLAEKDDGNLFFSPWSISSALAIAWEGARGSTASEIRSVCHFPDNSTMMREGFAGANADLNRGDSGKTLRSANALWAEQTFPFLPEYISTAERTYGAKTTNLDFITQPDASRKTINRWVEEQTEEKIRDLLPDGSIDPRTRLVITNAIYFKGTWVKQFNESTTTEEDFLTGDGTIVRVPMMQRTDKDAIYRYGETGTLQVLGMPYESGSGRQLSMLVLLPKSGNLATFEQSLDVTGLSELQQNLSSQRVNVSFPKFSMETKYSLPGALSAMGMPTAFTPDADFSGMDGKRDLFIDDVIHQAFVEVDEEGTEAAAATAVVIRMTSLHLEEPVPVFRADHPFIILIQDDETGNILFMGRVMDPSGT